MERVGCDGLTVTWGEYLGDGIPMERSDCIRVVVPLGQEDALVGLAEERGACVESLLESPYLWVIPPQAAAGFRCLKSTRVLTFSLVPRFCASVAFAAGRPRSEVVDPCIAYDRTLRNIASVFGAALRLGRRPEAAYMRSIARDLAIHVPSVYGRPGRRARCQGLSAERMARALQLIDENMATAIRVEQVAAGVNMSLFHFARMFKQSTGYSPHFYLTLKRMDRARQLLAESSLPLAQVAQKLGYSTQAHFTGVFRAYAGTTPRAYRTRFRNKGERESL